MALFGVQVVASMIMVFLLSKFSPKFSFGRWLLSCGRLARYLHPSDDELRKLAGLSTSGNSGNKNKSSGHLAGKRNEASKRNSKYNNPSSELNQPFTILKSTDIKLELAPIHQLDLLPLHFYDEFVWLLDISACGFIIFGLTDAYFYFIKPSKEMNLSIIWCLLIVVFCLKTLINLTGIYFKNEDGGEKILCLLFGFFFLVVSMAVLIIHEDTLEFGLETSYQNFSISARDFLISQGLEDVQPISLLTLRIILAFLCSILGATLTFPGLRLAKMHTDCLRFSKNRTIDQVLLYINFILPLLISAMWIKPLFREYFTGMKYRKVSSEPLMTDFNFDFLRLTCIIIFCLFRFSLVWMHLQSHLNMASDKMEELKKEAGRISSTDIKTLVVRVYYYLCIVALQYLTPVLLLLFSSLALKTLGNFSIPRSFGLLIDSDYKININVSSIEPNIDSNFVKSDNSEGFGDLIASTAIQFSGSINKFKLVFSAQFLYVLISFFSWWTCVSWFVTTSFGVLYHSKFML